MTPHHPSVNQALKILASYKDYVWPEINQYLKDPLYPLSFRIPNKYQNIACKHWQIVRDYPLRQGKYLRPALLLLTCEAIGVDKKFALNTAAAMQISEDFWLIHDDFEDNSPIRRGQSTLHKIYGPALAINAGDTLGFIIWKILNNNIELLSAPLASSVTKEFSNMLIRTAIGQSTEIIWTQENKINSKDSDWFFICDGKTSYYTIAGPMRLGAMIAGATNKELTSLSKFGLYLGRCFQLIDDVLDVTSDFSGLKKQRGNDIYEGKRTILLGHLLRSAPSPEKKAIIKILSKPREKKTETEILWIIKLMQQYGSITYAQNLAKKFYLKACKIFRQELCFLKHQAARKKLAALIDFVLERQY